jgi:hypothetical protein
MAATLTTSPVISETIAPSDGVTFKRQKVIHKDTEIHVLEVDLLASEWKYLNEGADHIIVAFSGKNSPILVSLINSLG